MIRRMPMTVIAILIAILLAGCQPSDADRSATATAYIATSDALKSAHFQTQTAKPPPTLTPSYRDAFSVRLGMLADDVLELRGHANSTKVVGEDQFGLIVEWWYADSVYVMARREEGGITAYRVVRIRTP